MPITFAHSKQRISDFQFQVNEQAVKIREIAQSAWDGVATNKSEPQIVYDFLSKRGVGTDYLNTHLAPLAGSGGRVVKFASVFLHQKPMVLGCATSDFEGSLSSHKCELGDLQIVFLYLAADKTVCQCRSTIFQAKMEPHTGPFVIAHEHQRRLYDHAFGFKYATILPGQNRRLPKDAARERALQYLFVGQRPVRSRTIPADAGAGSMVDFGEFMLRLLNDSSGLAVSSSPDHRGAWSQIVWDMLSAVAETVTLKGEVRNSGLAGLLNHFNSFEDKATYFVGEGTPGDSGGFGMLLVITSDGELGGVEPNGGESPGPVHQPHDGRADVKTPDIKKEISKEVSRYLRVRAISALLNPLAHWMLTIHSAVLLCCVLGGIGIMVYVQENTNRTLARQDEGLRQNYDGLADRLTTGGDEIKALSGVLSKAWESEDKHFEQNNALLLTVITNGIFNANTAFSNLQYTADSLRTAVTNMNERNKRLDVINSNLTEQVRELSKVMQTLSNGPSALNH
jgi:hypothetical protein